MKNIKEILDETGDGKSINAYGNRLRKKDGNDVILPGHVIDFVEDGADKVKEFDHTILVRNGYHLTRNTQVRKNVDVVHKVVNKRDKWKKDLIDRT